MTSKFSDEELVQLYQIACEQGWDALEQSERIALGRWCTKTGRKRPGQAPSKPVKPVEGGDEYFEAIGLSKDARTAEDLRLLKSVRLLDDFPEDVINGCPGSDYADVVKALRRFGKPCVVRGGMTRKRAMELRHTIRSGRTSTWRPEGAYRAEVAPDHDSDGGYRVIAQYVGGE